MSNHSIFQKAAFTFNIFVALLQQLLGVVSAGLFYGAVSSFIRYYVQLSNFDIFSPKMKAKMD